MKFYRNIFIDLYLEKKFKQPKSKAQQQCKYNANNNAINIAKIWKKFEEIDLKTNQKFKTFEIRNINAKMWMSW